VIVQADLADDECWRTALCLEAATVPAAHTDSRRERVVRVVDRVTAKTVVVYWCDATSCRYGDQVWRMGVTKRRGRCALSGAPINAGDAVYRPRQGRLPPVNAGAMMLAFEVERVLPG
jgi:hypothetical protein